MVRLSRANVFSKGDFQFGERLTQSWAQLPLPVDTLKDGPTLICHFDTVRTEESLFLNLTMKLARLMQFSRIFRLTLLIL
jgi:hypothetical protein